MQLLEPGALLAGLAPVTARAVRSVPSAEHFRDQAAQAPPAHGGTARDPEEPQSLTVHDSDLLICTGGVSTFLRLEVGTSDADIVGSGDDLDILHRRPTEDIPETLDELRVIPLTVEKMQAYQMVSPQPRHETSSFTLTPCAPTVTPSPTDPAPSAGEAPQPHAQHLPQARARGTVCQDTPASGRLRRERTRRGHSLSSPFRPKASRAAGLWGRIWQP